jgi:hypothetical protein
VGSEIEKKKNTDLYIFGAKQLTLAVVGVHGLLIMCNHHEYTMSHPPTILVH